MQLVALSVSTSVWQKVSAMLRLWEIGYRFALNQGTCKKPKVLSNLTWKSSSLDGLELQYRSELSEPKSRV